MPTSISPRKRRNWKPIKEMLIAYLAVSKILYWINIISATDNIEGMIHSVSQRLLEQDIVLILFIVFGYLFEAKLIWKQKKWNSVFTQIVLAVGSYVVFIIILTAYLRVMAWIFPIPSGFGFFWLNNILSWSITYFIIMIAMTLKQHFKKKEAAEYVLDVQSTSIKLEMLETLLADGVLSQDAFDKQKEKLQGV